MAKTKGAGRPRKNNAAHVEIVEIVDKKTGVCHKMAEIPIKSGKNGGTEKRVRK